MVSFGYTGEIKAFSHKQNLRQFTTIRPASQEMLKVAFQPEKVKVYKTLSKMAKIQTEARNYNLLSEQDIKQLKYNV